MGKYTKEERHEAYKHALETMFTYMCPAVRRGIARSTGDDVSNIGTEDINEENFPELFSFRPQDPNFGDIWFDGEDRASRIAVLKKCIEMTK